MLKSTFKVDIEFDIEFDIDFNMEFEIEFNIEFDFGFNFGGGSEPPYTMKIWINSVSRIWFNLSY